MGQGRVVRQKRNHACPPARRQHPECYIIRDHQLPQMVPDLGWELASDQASTRSLQASRLDPIHGSELAQAA